MTTSALFGAQCPPGPGQAACQLAARHGMATVVLVRAAPGPAGSAALARHIRHYRALTSRPGKPTVLVNFGESVNFPLLFGIALSLFGAATMVHLLLVSVARRRTETGLLKVLGFVRRQVGAAVCWQATTIALAGIAVGVPLGIAAGRVDPEVPRIHQLWGISVVLSAASRTGSAFLKCSGDRFRHEGQMTLPNCATVTSAGCGGR